MSQIASPAPNRASSSSSFYSLWSRRRSMLARLKTSPVLTTIRRIGLIILLLFLIHTMLLQVFCLLIIAITITVYGLAYF
ncbi:hypothetical protein AMTR_s00033p00121020 [Amborella trichopoda]|uniref:Uncharacterized protein n=1 Tax=Amborella trichopoda TaxID=13333 RepID=U5CYK0_AMBTC|nr:hypothetical protein AMTR_s00033p00121020 [Amborella trichopoda]